MPDETASYGRFSDLILFFAFRFYYEVGEKYIKT